MLLSSDAIQSALSLSNRRHTDPTLERFREYGPRGLDCDTGQFRPNYQVDGYEYRHIGPRRNATLSSTLKCSGVSVNTDMQRKNSMPGNLLIQLRRFDNQHVAVPSNEDPHGIDWRIR